MRHVTLEKALVAAFRSDDGCRIEGKRIALKMGKGRVPYYYVDLRTCKTAEELLHWIVHLSEKRWLRRGQLRAFVLLAAGENGIDVGY